MPDLTLHSFAFSETEITQLATSSIFELFPVSFQLIFSFLMHFTPKFFVQTIYRKAGSPFDFKALSLSF